MKILYSLLIFYLIGLNFINSQKCSVTIEGNQFDLSPLIKSDEDYKVEAENGDTYYFNICNSTVGNNPCGNSAVAYRYSAADNKCYSLGNTREYYSVHSMSKSKSISVSYRHGDRIPNSVNQRYELLYVFNCDGNAGNGEPMLYEVNEYGAVVVHWSSKYGCTINKNNNIHNKKKNNNNNNNINELKQIRKSRAQQEENDENPFAFVQQEMLKIKEPKFINLQDEYNNEKQYHEQEQEQLVEYSFDTRLEDEDDEENYYYLNHLIKQNQDEFELLKNTIAHEIQEHEQINQQENGQIHEQQEQEKEQLIPEQHDIKPNNPNFNDQNEDNEYHGIFFQN